MGLFGRSKNSTPTISSPIISPRQQQQIQQQAMIPSPLIQPIQQMEGEPSALVVVDENDEQFLQRLETQLGHAPILPALATRVGLPRVHVLFLLIILVSLPLVAYTAGLSTIINFIAFIYPAYQSYKTLQTDDIEMHRHWLIYWVVYGLYHVCEIVGDVTLYWLQYYQILKLVFLLWCFIPYFSGCRIVYTRHMQPFFLQHHDTISIRMEQIQMTTTKARQEITSILINLIPRMITGMLLAIRSPDAPPASISPSPRSRRIPAHSHAE